jgi:Helix-turn-helix domain
MARGLRITRGMNGNRPYQATGHIPTNGSKPQQEQGVPTSDNSEVRRSDHPNGVVPVSRRPRVPRAELRQTAAALGSPYFDEHQAAAFLLVATSTLQNWRLAGRGPRYRKFGSRVLYTREDLIAWAECHIRTSTSDAISPDA